MTIGTQALQRLLRFPYVTLNVALTQNFQLPKNSAQSKQFERTCEKPIYPIVARHMSGQCQFEILVELDETNTHTYTRLADMHCTRFNLRAQKRNEISSSSRRHAKTRRGDRLPEVVFVSRMVCIVIETGGPKQ